MQVKNVDILDFFSGKGFSRKFAAGAQKFGGSAFFEKFDTMPKVSR
jgi:hypothetical protein